MTRRATSCTAPTHGALNCPVCGSGEVGDCVCPPRCTAPTHGTLWAYNVHGCRCPEALARRRASAQRHLARQQAETVLSASSYAMPWDAESDRELLTGSGTLLERAERVGRTYWAARNRLTRLRAQEAS